MIVPSDIDISELDREFTKAFTQLVDIAEDEFRKSYHNWDNQPEFKTTSSKSIHWEVEYSTEDNPYVWVDDGTPEHIITAVNAPSLAFQYPSKPRTFPGKLSSGNASSGPNWATPKEVTHPGIKPRLFSNEVELIMNKKVEPGFLVAHNKIKSL